MNGQETKKLVTPDELKQAKDDPVNFLLGKIQEEGKTDYCLDGDDKPCLEIKDDPTQKLYRLVDDQGKSTPRTKSYVRSMFRYVTGEQLHLGNTELLLIVDYLVEEAYKGGRKTTRTEPAKDGDYNFEGVVVFANSLRGSDDPEKGLGNKLLEGILAGEKEQRLQPKITRNGEQHFLTAELRTADLWRAVNSRDIEIQVRADKKTLFNAINFFSRRLGELDEQFRKVGLEVHTFHRDSGSWVTITRHDQVFLPDNAILVTTDDNPSSASGPSSGSKLNDAKALERTDDNHIETESPVGPNAA